jgi:hypothetical protein
MLDHVEFHGETCWEAFGSGEGSGDDAIAMALDDLTSVAGGTLPVGEYRCIGATSGSNNWETIWLGADGQIVASEDAEAPARHRWASRPAREVPATPPPSPADPSA